MLIFATYLYRFDGRVDYQCMLSCGVRRVQVVVSSVCVCGVFVEFIFLWCFIVVATDLYVVGKSSGLVN